MDDMQDDGWRPVKPGFPRQQREVVQTIDMTPTWYGVLPLLLAAYSEGTTATARSTALEELKRMAALADLYVAGENPGTEKKQGE